MPDPRATQRTEESQVHTPMGSLKDERAKRNRRDAVSLQSGEHRKVPMSQSGYQKASQATIVPTKVHHCHLLSTIMYCDKALCQILNSRQCGPTLANNMLEGRARHLEGREKVGIGGGGRVTVEEASIVDDPGEGTPRRSGGMAVAGGALHRWGICRFQIGAICRCPHSSGLRTALSGHQRTA